MTLKRTRFLQKFWGFTLLLLIFTTAAPAMLLAAPPPASTNTTVTATPGPLILLDHKESYGLGTHGRYLLDATRQLTLEDITSPENASRFQPHQRDTFNFGITDSAIWIRLELENRSDHKDWILELGYAQLDQVAYFGVSPSGQITRMVSGDSLPMSRRNLPQREIIFPISLDKGQRLTVYLKVLNHSTSLIPLSLKTERNFHRKSRIESGFLILMMGILSTWVLFSLLVTLVQRQRANYYFTLYAIAGFTYLISLNGLGYDYFWGEEPQWNNRIFIFSFYLSMVGLALFSQAFLNFRVYLPGWRWIAYFAALFGIILAPGFTWIEETILFKILHLFVLVLILFLLAGALLCWFRGQIRAPHYLFSFLPILFLAGFAQISSLGGIAQGYITTHMIPLGVFLNIFITGIALAYYLSGLYKEKQYFKSEYTRLSALESPHVSVSPAIPDFQRADRVLIQTFGQFRVWKAGERIQFSKRGMPRHLELLFVVLSLGSEEVSLSLISEELWPDSDGDKAQNAFRITLFRLRKILGQEVLILKEGQLSLDTRLCEVDSLVFQKSLDHIKSEPVEESWKALAEALVIYKGDFLPSWEHPAGLAYRERSRLMYRNMVERLGSHYLSQGMVGDAEKLFQEALIRDPEHEKHWSARLTGVPTGGAMLMEPSLSANHN